MKKILIAIVILAIAGGLFLYTRSKNTVKEPETISVTASPQEVDPTQIPESISRKMTLSGTYTCLPPKDTSGPQTLECALGLKTTDGSHYGLSMDQSLAMQAAGGEQVTVEGLVVPVEALSSMNYQKYDIKGVMQVERVVKN